MQTTERTSATAEQDQTSPTATRAEIPGDGVEPWRKALRAHLEAKRQRIEAKRQRIVSKRQNTVARAEIPIDGFMRLPQVLAVYPVSKSHWWNLVKEGVAPRPVKLGKRCTAWRATEIRALVDSTALKAPA